MWDAKSLAVSWKEKRCSEKAVQTSRAAILEISKEMAILLRIKNGFSPLVSVPQYSQLWFSSALSTPHSPTPGPTLTPAF